MITKRTMEQKRSMDLAHRSAKAGVFFKTPVFDGADFETEIQAIITGA